MKKSIIERIYENIVGDIQTRCWNWTGYLDKWGYGKISLNHKSQSVHRLIYQELCGPIPEDKPLVLHHCDNPKCCNPMHLYAGTHKDNMKDKAKRNRCNSPYGEKNGRSKLTEEQVLEIRQSKALQVIIAKRFNVGKTAISDIKNRKKWKHL